MKKYTKPAAEAMETEAQQMLADSMPYTGSPAQKGKGDEYSDGLVKEENSSFWE